MKKPPKTDMFFRKIILLKAGKFYNSGFQLYNMKERWKRKGISSQLEWDPVGTVEPGTFVYVPANAAPAGLCW